MRWKFPPQLGGDRSRLEALSLEAGRQRAHRRGCGARLERARPSPFANCAGPSGPSPPDNPLSGLRSRDCSARGNSPAPGSRAPWSTRPRGRGKARLIRPAAGTGPLLPTLPLRWTHSHMAGERQERSAPPPPPQRFGLEVVRRISVLFIVFARISGLLARQRGAQLSQAMLRCNIFLDGNVRCT